VGNHDVVGAEESTRRRWRGKAKEQPRTSLKQLDLQESLRLATIPIGLGASATMRSPWLFLAAAAYNIVGGPLHDFLAKVLDAAGDRLERRIRDGRWGDQDPS
jgi:hypothetical protein